MNSIFTAVIGLCSRSVSSWVHSSRLGFKESVHFVYVAKLMCVELFVILPQHPFLSLRVLIAVTLSFLIAAISFFLMSLIG